MAVLCKNIIFPWNMTMSLRQIPHRNTYKHIITLRCNMLINLLIKALTFINPKISHNPMFLHSMLYVLSKEFQTRVDEDTLKSELVIPSLHLNDRGVYNCTANNFIGNSSVSILVDVTSPNGSQTLSPAFPVAATEENVYIDIRIAKQTVYGITIEWYAVTEKPSETWFTIHFGRYDEPKKELIYIGPGINTYSVTDLMPATKYDICVTLKNQVPRNGQCIVFVTGSDMSEMEQREKLIHIVVIVLAMVLAVPAGMYACTTDTKFYCFERGMEKWRNWRREEAVNKPDEGQGAFDSLQAASDEGLCKDFSESHKTRRKSDDRLQKTKFDRKPTTQLY